MDASGLINFAFFAGVSALFYAYALYPVLLSMLSPILRKPVKNELDYQPEITIVIAAYNEEELIEDAIRSIFNNGYPPGKIFVIAGSDGSSDETVKILQTLQTEFANLSVYALNRSGKNKTLNSIVKYCETGLIFFMDADIRIMHGALQKLVSNFSDEDVGAAIAMMVPKTLTGEDSGGAGELLYQKYENYIRANESEIFSTVGSLGALYGIRKKYYKPLPNDKVCDDFMPLLDVAILKQRVYFDKTSIVQEVRNKSLKGEFARRARVSGGGLATVWEARNLLLPKYGWFAFFLWSHRIMRWFSPFFLILLAVSTLLMSADTLLFKVSAALQAAFYGFAFLGIILERFGVKFFISRMALYFLTMSAGFLVAIFRFVFGFQNSAWDSKKQVAKFL